MPKNFHRLTPEQQAAARKAFAKIRLHPHPLDRSQTAEDIEWHFDRADRNKVVSYIMNPTDR